MNVTAALRNDKMESAVTSVLEIPELLQAIIIELPIRNIFQARRVSRLWRDAIGDSLAIRKKLFLKQTEKVVAPSPVIHAPIQGKIEYACHFEPNNTFMNLLHGAVFDGRDQKRPGFVAMTRNFRIGDDIGHGRSRSFGSMFITQPPCTTAVVRVIGDFKPIAVGCSLRNSEGLRCKDVVEVVEKMLSGAQKLVLKSRAQFNVNIWSVYSDEEALAWEEDWRRQVGR